MGLISIVSPGFAKICQKFAFVVSIVSPEFIVISR